MLVECTIRNFAVIEYAHVQFHKGFHVLTGETGAGKSMIIDALTLIAGGRSSAEWVRHGSAKAEIECVFDLEPNHPVHDTLHRFGLHLAPDDYLIVRREITSQGKSIARLNGQAVNLSLLREIGDALVNIHGQHEHQSLLFVDKHIGLLDSYAGDDLMDILRRYEASYQQYQAHDRALNELERKSKEQLQMVDLYTFQLEELSAAQLTPGEDGALEEERDKLANAEKLALGAQEAYDALNGNQASLELIHRATSRLHDIIEHDAAALSPLLEQMQTAYYQLEDAAFQLRDYCESIEFNPARLDQIEHRLNLIAGLRRKYGNTIEEMLEYKERIAEQLDQIVNLDAHRENLQQQRQQALDETLQLAAQLTKERKKASEALSRKIMEQLQHLHMDKTVFQVSLHPLAKPTANGMDEVEFLIAPNPGEPLRPLHKIASGGELSRIMLALKTIFAETERIPVLVFDEVDTGVSGRAAQAIAEKLSQLADQCQVFSITHLPQVACMADTHYLIEKEVKGDRTYTNVTELDVNTRVIELARMLGGVEVTETTEQHAKEMLDMAAEKKERWHHLQ